MRAAGLSYPETSRSGATLTKWEAWKAAGHTIFFLKAGWTNIEFWQQVQKLARCFRNIIDCARRSKPGESFIVTVNGKIS
jgi:hypothetical protein